MAVCNAFLPPKKPEVYNSMTLDDLRALHEAMPPGSAINLPREALGELLGELIQPDAEVREVRDLTLSEVAHSVGRPRIPLLSDQGPVGVTALGV